MSAATSFWTFTDFGTTFSDYNCFSIEFKIPTSFPQGKSWVNVFFSCVDVGYEVLRYYHCPSGYVGQNIDRWSSTSHGGHFQRTLCFSWKIPVKYYYEEEVSLDEILKYFFFSINDSVAFRGQISSPIIVVYNADLFCVEALIVCAQVGYGLSYTTENL